VRINAFENFRKDIGVEKRFIHQPIVSRGRPHGPA
jgi:hypothetical protein